MPTDRGRLLELRREAIWRKCQRDEKYFLRNYWNIATPAVGRMLFDLRDAQTEALDRWERHRYSLTLKARQIGWTTLVSAHQFWLAFFRDDQNIIDISRTEREAILLLKKTKYGYRNLPDWMIERGPRLVDNTQTKLSWDNQSQIQSLPSASDPARGEAATLIVVDEWAFLPNPEDAWASIEPVADVGGRIIGLSTANGSGNFFHQLWVGAETGNNQFDPMFFPWSAGDRDEDWYATKKRSMLPWQLAQEYPSSPEEAFIKSGRAVFDIDALMEKVRVMEPEVGYLQELTGPKDIQWRPNHELDPDDPVAIWEFPSPQGLYVIGADTAEGLEWGDYSSAHVVEVHSGRVVATWHGHVPADQFANELMKLGYWYNTALLGVESNNHGLTTITALRKAGYKKLYRRRRLNKAQGDTRTTEYGWSTTKTTKPLMIDELARDLREGELILNCGDTLGELKTYVRDDHGRMGGSPFDDRVISLAIVNQMIKHAFAPEYKEKEDPYMTLDWWANLKHEEYYDDPRSGSGTIGAHSVRGTR